MGYYPDCIDHECHKPKEVHLGNMQKGENCYTSFGVVHVWKLGVGCRGCRFFYKSIDKKDDEDDEDDEDDGDDGE